MTITPNNLQGWCAAAAAKSLQLCPTLCDPIDGSPLGSSVPGILQERVLEWVAIAFSKSQCNPYQIDYGIFRIIRTKNFTICMKHKILQIAEAIMRKKNGAGEIKAPWFQIILQTYRYQKSMVLAQKQKYRSMEQDRKPRDKPTHLWSPNTWQRKKE